MEPGLKLSAGIQTFERLIDENCIYVDKTKHLVEMIDNGSAYFLSRPRRFGKSLTVTTFDALFSGNKNLFKGLYAEEFLNRPDFKPSPVISLDMSMINTSQGIDILTESIKQITLEMADRLKVEIPQNLSYSDTFRNLIENTAKKYSTKVVVLVDEYDNPFTDFIDNPEMAEKVRNLLRNYYKQIKAKEKYIKFIFITGISKFTKMGVFSTLNNLVDISLRDEYITLCGYTEEEIIKYFPDYLEAIANKFKISIDELIERMRKFYNGFSFNGVTKLYNPFSTLEFLGEKNFFSFWIDTGSTSMIAKYLKTQKVTVEEFRGLQVSLDFAKSPGEIEKTPPQGFLYQAGYLSLRKDENDNYFLDYPNTEVLNSMSRLLTENIFNDDANFYQTSVINAITNKNAEKLIKALNGLLANIPYDDYTKSAERYIEYHDCKIPAHEWLYRSTMLAFFRGCGMSAIGEFQTNLGRPDLLVSYKNSTWIMEIKVAYKGDSPHEKLEEALQQIKDKNYATPFPEAVCITMAIEDEKRQIMEWRIES